MIECQRYETVASIREAGYPPGAFAWTETWGEPGVISHIYICVPLDESVFFPVTRIRLLRVYRKGFDPPDGVVSWEWNYNLDRPTLRPSIGVNPKDPETGQYAYHGYLTDGVLEET